MADILIKCGKSGFNCGEVPMNLRCDLQGGASKVPVRTTAGQTLLLLRRRFTSNAPR